jgi:hypothetical protein
MPSPDFNDPAVSCFFEELEPRITALTAAVCALASCLFAVPALGLFRELLP